MNFDRTIFVISDLIQSFDCTDEYNVVMKIKRHVDNQVILSTFDTPKKFKNKINVLCEKYSLVRQNIADLDCFRWDLIFLYKLRSEIIMSIKIIYDIYNCIDYPVPLIGKNLLIKKIKNM